MLTRTLYQADRRKKKTNTTTTDFCHKSPTFHPTFTLLLLTNVAIFVPIEIKDL